MAKLSLSEVSNRFNVSRSTLYRAIKEGRISRSSDGLFDIAEVIRCFGEPIKNNEQNQVVGQPKDDADLRQLVDFMKKEIESYKDREKRYLDQIDRFQLLLGHKDSEDKPSHDTPVRHSTETPCDNLNETSESIDSNHTQVESLPHDTPVRHSNSAPQNKPMTHHETPKKRSFFGRLLKAALDN